MGWFWADSTPAPSKPVAPHPKVPSASNVNPPPSCPMHKPTDPAPAPPSTSPACPYVPPTNQSPISDRKPYGDRSETISKLNPLNWMPSNISNKPSQNQEYSLPLEREPSTIPRGDGAGKWEYPSPQQMYNAMLRKGHHDTPVDAVEAMVAVHNFLNEGAWSEIMEWERRYGKSLVDGFKHSMRGEAGTIHRADADIPWLDREVPEPQLVRFMGRPKEMTPKARLLQAAGWAFPDTFGQEPPFDRHDWFVKRHTADGSSKEVRYVIDYYSGPPEEDGSPVFFLDVRPAVDSPAAAAARMMRWGGDIWYRGTGAEARENANSK